jgi:hypothetical protein
LLELRPVGAMVLQSPMVIVLILLFGIQVDFQAAFARGPSAKVLFEPFGDNFLRFLGSNLA